MFLGNGDGTFQPLIMLNSTGSCILTNDFDHDGFSDIIICYLSVIQIFLHCNVTDIDTPYKTGSQITILPNPANHFQTIQINNLQKETLQVKLLDISGRLINCWQMNSNPTGITEINVQLESLENGIYFYHIQLGTEYCYKKFIKE